MGTRDDEYDYLFKGKAAVAKKMMNMNYFPFQLS